MRRIVPIALAVMNLLAGLEQSNAAIIKVDFEGHWTSETMEYFGPDSPWEPGERFSGFFVYDDSIDVPDNQWDDSIASFSLTFEGLGSIRWDAAAVPDPPVGIGGRTSTTPSGVDYGPAGAEVWSFVAPYGLGWSGDLDLVMFEASRVDAPPDVVPPEAIILPWYFFWPRLDARSSTLEIAYEVEYEAGGLLSKVYGSSRGAVESFTFTNVNPGPPEIPEPASLALLAGGLSCLAALAKLRRW